MTRGVKPDYAAVVEYAKAHPYLLLREIGDHFSIDKTHAGLILRTVGGISNRHRMGKTPKRHRDMSDEQYHWEVILHRCGLGMDRGSCINGKTILYGYDESGPEYDDGTRFSPVVSHP